MTKKDLSGRCLYMIHAPQIDCYKIGISTNPRKRFKDIYHIVPIDVQLVFFMEHEQSSGIESSLHMKFQNYSVRPEWFRLTTEQAMEAVLSAVHYFIAPRSDNSAPFFVCADWYDWIEFKQTDSWYDNRAHRFILSKLEGGDNVA